MKQFVFGLGNPGEEYQATRHNVGYQTVDRITKELTGQSFQESSREQHKIKSRLFRAGELFFAESLTYMNESGDAVVATLDYFDKDLLKEIKSGSPAGTSEKPRLIVIYDDLDIPLGQWKLQFGKGPKVHNGLNSIRQHLGSDQFLHVRIGVDGRQGVRHQSGRDYVLTPFYGQEVDTIAQVLSEVGEALRHRLQ
jgi:PTH1 family peptidyl-tRNA hydrolase